MTDYKVEKILSEETVVLSSKYGTQIWDLVKLRKNKICEQTKIELPKGSKAFRPITNGYNRMDRISKVAMTTIIDLSKQ